jgi:acyl carrier protein
MTNDDQEVRMTEQDVLEKVRATLKEIKVPGADTAELATTWEALDVDSLDLVELVRALEDEYGIQVPDEKLDGVDTVGDAVRLTLELAQEGAKA